MGPRSLNQVRRFAIATVFLALAAPNFTYSQRAPSGSDFRLDIGRSFEASTPSGKKQTEVPVINSSIVGDVSEALTIIQRNHVAGSNTDNAALTKGIFSGMLRTLDPHSRFYDPSEFAELTGEHNSEYFGTGITIAGFNIDSSEGVYVISTATGSPAERSGMQFGDRIVAINEIDIAGSSVEEARNQIRGAKGSIVNILIRSAITGATKTVTMKRERISQPAIRNAFVMEDGTGYIGLTNGFAFSTAAEFSLAYADLRSRGMKSVVIDLRGNGGGIFNQAVEIAELFLSAGSHIVSQGSRYAADTQVWRSENQSPETLPLFLLVDERTASASEVLAAAMQDNDRAVIIGERTFGKGLVQDVVELENGSGMVLTTARYFGPSGRSIQREFSDAGNYAYFTRTNEAALIETSSTAYKTIGNRTVFGGNGIEPDRKIGNETELNLDEASVDRLEDLAFAEVLRRLRKGTPSQIERTSISFEGDPKRTAGFEMQLEKRIRYYAELAAGGQKHAEESSLKRELVMLITVRDLQLARTFIANEQERTDRKKARQVTSQTGQRGRNRRN